MANQGILDSPGEPTLWQEEHWSVLLEHIAERTVIPIIGSDLLQVEVEGQPILLDRYIAAQLARKYSLNESGSLHEVVCRLLQRDLQRDILYAAVHKILADAQFAPPRALLQLAGIRDFNLFVTTTFDTLLEKAIREVRKEEPKTLAYSPFDKKDIALDDLHRPTVYHLLGKSSALPFRYVVTEEDLLEFVHALQSESYRPRLLFDELKNKNLLMLGENFPDWLARFFLRTAKQCRLSESRRVMEFMADTHLHTQKSLAFFLRHFSKNTRVFMDGGTSLLQPRTSPVDFIDELSRRWHEAHPADASPAAKERDMPAGAVFISYTRKDIEPVRELYAGLMRAGLKVWFDYSRLEPGDLYDDKIKKNIGSCKCFLAVLSRNTEARREGYFRREWSYALRRAPDFDQSRPFIIPVIVDDLENMSAVPGFFHDLQFARLLGGSVTPEFVNRLKEIVDED